MFIILVCSSVTETLFICIHPVLSSLINWMLQLMLCTYWEMDGCLSLVLCPILSILVFVHCLTSSISYIYTALMHNNDDQVQLHQLGVSILMDYVGLILGTHYPLINMREGPCLCEFHSGELEMHMRRTLGSMLLQGR
jgi:hypothetical protein